MRWVFAVVVAACAAPAKPLRTRPAAAKVAPARPAFAAFPETAPFRLPHTFEPRGYRVRIVPGDTRFTGHIEIDGDLTEPTSLLWLHGVDLVVTSATATRDGHSVSLAFSGPRAD